MMNCKNIDTYKSQIISNNIQYSIAAGPYSTTHDMKVSFIIPDLSIRNIITHHFYVDNL